MSTVVKILNLTIATDNGTPERINAVYQLRDSDTDAVLGRIKKYEITGEAMNLNKVVKNSDIAGELWYDTLAAIKTLEGL